MPRLTYLGGTGAVGSAMARFFHPGKPIRDKWPQDNKRRLTSVLVTGEAVRRVYKRDQDCYLVCIAEIDDGREFYIVKRNFKVDQPPPSPFESKARQQPEPTPAANNTERGSERNAVLNVDGRSRNLTRGEIEELRQQGIEVDDDNKLAPENVPRTKDPPPPIKGVWEKPTHCPRRAINCQDRSGSFTNHRWDEIADYDELQLFRMCFPEKWLVNVCIPMTNKELSKKTTLQEFYVFLGCIFYMAC
jgi:hypothetical protein